MSTATLVSVAEYLRMTEKPSREYRDGVLYPKSMATSSHGIVQGTLVSLLRQHNVQAGSEISVKMSPTKVLVPDVIADRVLQDPYPTEPVLLCCEILSPEDRLGATLAKCEEYHSWGVPFCWVIDPVKRAAWEYHAAGEPVRVTGTLSAGEIAVGVQELFAPLG
jgi:Uma2 family endonuclease